MATFKNQNRNSNWPNGTSTTNFNLEATTYSNNERSTTDGCSSSNRRAADNSHFRLKLNEDSGSCGSGSGSTSSSNENTDRPNLPAEVQKTLLCFAMMVAVLGCNLFFSAVVHDRTPTKKDEPDSEYPPLRDISFDIAAPWNLDKFLLLTICEVILAASTGLLVVVACLHRYKWIVLRRMFFLVALLFTFRLITMNVTMLPTSSTGLYKCDAKSATMNGGVLLSRLLDLLATCGMANVKFCGNYVYSGHVVLLVLNCLVMGEYCPSWIINLPLKVASACGVLAIMASEFDYTISVITAYYITTRIFWIYHTFANNSSLKNLTQSNVNQVCKEWWYPIFRFLEGNVNSVVPPMKSSFL